jgi:hypothetical protein
LTSPASARRGTASSVRLGGSFELLFDAAIIGHREIALARVHPETKMIPDGHGGRKLIHVKKNGVDFVGIAFGRGVAVELKRLPNAPSLRISKDDSTESEARFLLDFAKKGGAAGFLVYDPERERIYLVHHPKKLEALVRGDVVPLRDRDGAVDAAHVWCDVAGAPGATILAVRVLMQRLAESATPVVR